MAQQVNDWKQKIHQLVADLIKGMEDGLNMNEDLSNAIFKNHNASAVTCRTRLYSARVSMVEPPLELKPNIDELTIEQANVVEPDVEQPNVVEPDVEQPNVVATKAGFTIVIGKSDNGGNRRKPYFLLSCSRGGVYKEKKRKLKKQHIATKTLKCSFRLRGYFLASHEWKLSVVCGEHNHEMAKTLEGHTLAGRLKPEEKECVQELTRNLVPPKNILTTLRGRNPDSKTNMKQVYNTRESVKLFNTFPTVLMMDSTYKYKMPLFEIVGVTSTEDSFNVGFAFIANEKEDNFLWALEMRKSLLNSKDTFPKVIVTDRDKSLMNAVPIVFPNSTALVCRYHVSKNVRAKFKAFCGAKEKNLDQLLNTLTFQWESIVQSSSEESYTSAVAEFRKVFEKYPNFLDYVETTVLDPVKENFVSLWTNRVMHIGNTTTNRVESQHGVLKQYVTDYKPCTLFGVKKIVHVNAMRLTRIGRGYKLVKTMMKRVDCSKEFNAIQERLNSSDYAMNLQIRDQLRQIAYPEITSLTPPVKQFETKGAKKRGKSANSSTREPSLWEHIDAQFPDSQASQSKPSIPKRKTARIGNLSPNAIPRRVIKYIEYMPLFMHSYIEDIIDVKGDGHCGFRVVAEYLNKGEDSHVVVRHKLIRELTMFRKEYLSIYQTEERLQYILNGLYPPKVMPKSGIALVENWLTFLDMGHILATAYNCVVVELTTHKIDHFETFFPLCGRPPLDPSARMMCIGMVSNHCVYVKLKDGCHFFNEISNKLITGALMPIEEIPVVKWTAVAFEYPLNKATSSLQFSLTFTVCPKYSNKVQLAP
ncbi:hypothetical protein TSUD_411730 [Trifolium subterraneum]|uniref:OTU domain-containing protein n=1 Tax=Trifolium subterraneum TaxID=3900 RepID=A0A2Z6P3Q4_TRISU|nr:hypothetical protein TSUD_411730 [Trifolium subterraneum]